MSKMMVKENIRKHVNGRGDKVDYTLNKNCKERIERKLNCFLRIESHLLVYYFSFFRIFLRYTYCNL